MSTARLAHAKKGNGSAHALRGEDFADMRPRLDLAATVKGLIAPNSLVAIIGASGAGKTFFACDLACHIAAGMSWYGRKVSGGLVVYCALEGGGSYRDRFSAWRIHHLRDRGSIPLRAMKDSINLREPADQLRLIEFIREAESDHGEKCALAFIDTLSRAMAGGNENAPDDMGALIGGADALRAGTGASVVLVHHLGKDETRGARGHNSLRAALDTEIEVTPRGKQRVAAVTKQRDWPDGDRFAFTLEAVELGESSDGDAVTSCIVCPCDVIPEPKPEMKGKAQRQLLTALRGRGAATIWTLDAMRAVGRELGMHKSTARAAVEALAFSPFMSTTIGGYRLNE